VWRLDKAESTNDARTPDPLRFADEAANIHTTLTVISTVLGNLYIQEVESTVSSTKKASNILRKTRSWGRREMGERWS